jgi:hypothetical protein
MDPEDRRRPTPVASRVLERRTRTRTRGIPSEVLPVAWLMEGAVWLARVFGRGVVDLARGLRLGMAPPLAQLPPAPAGEPVTVRGVIEPLAPTFATPGARAEVVFARTIFANRERPGQPRTLSDELRGVDFNLRLASGELVEVAAAEVHLLGTPRRVFRANLAELERRGGDTRDSLLFRLPPFVREHHLLSGDHVEAFGLLVRQVAPGGEAVSGRGTPLVTRLVPPTGTKHILVRRLS